MVSSAQRGQGATTRIVMTKLSVISNNHISLECNCGHRNMIAVSELLKTQSEDTTIYEIARKAVCVRCKRKGAKDFRLHYVCK